MPPGGVIETMSSAPLVVSAWTMSRSLASASVTVKESVPELDGVEHG